MDQAIDELRVAGPLPRCHRGGMGATGAVPSAPLALPLVGGRYVDWGVISISVTNLVIIIAMVVVFVLALVLPFPHQHDDER